MTAVVDTPIPSGGEAEHGAPRAGGMLRHCTIWTAVGGGLVLGFAGWLVSHLLMQAGDHGSDRVVLITEICWAVGFMTGIGAFAGPIRWLLGNDLDHADEMFLAGKDQGVKRYLRYTTDHKVVGIQYLVVVMVLLGVGGANAMLIRTNLIRPGSHLFGPQTYNALVGLHGIIMIVATIIMVTGPFGNFILPIMIGARDMAYPRLNALSLWLIVAAAPCILSAPFLGGIPTGWVAYNPLADQAPPGMDAFIMFICIFAISTAVAGANITATVMTMRARGMTWNRTPIFVWGAVASVGLALPAFPMFMTSQIFSALDRSMGFSFYNPALGGSPWLYANLFWLMGHPEVYVIVLPAVAALMEITPVFARKPLYSFTIAVLGIVGICGLSVMVWAHHMYAAGWAPALNGPYMLTTELISIPTGLLFFVVIGTLWRGRIWTRLPMMAVYAMLWNFIIGGVTGIYLSDVPADYALHGSMFVTAHFHYTLMGAALTGAIGALAYWFPKMTGRMLDEKVGFVSFWLVQIGFNVTFFGMFAVGLAGQPRRVATYDHLFAVGNLVSTLGAYMIGTGMLILLYDVVSSWRHGEIAITNPWGAKTLEWTVPYPIPLENFEVLPVVTSDAYGYGEDDPGAEIPGQRAPGEPGPVTPEAAGASAAGTATLTTTVEETEA